MTSAQLNLFALFFVTVNYCGLGGNVSLAQVCGAFLIVVGTVCSYLTIAYNEEGELKTGQRGIAFTIIGTSKSISE